MAKTKVFVSFNFDNDKTLKEFIIGQAKNSDSPFEISDHSLKEKAPETQWRDRPFRCVSHYVIGLQSGREPTLRKRCQTSGLSGSQAIESTF